MAGINKELYDKKCDDKMLTKKEVMEYFRIKNDRTFNNLIEEQNLPYIKIGRNYLIPSDELQKWVKRNMYN